VLGTAAWDATWRLLSLPAAGYSPVVARTPRGWISLSRRGVGDSRAPSALESYLYASADGVHWTQIPISAQNDNLSLRGAAYGGGQYVLAGVRREGGGRNVVFTSRDGESWSERDLGDAGDDGLAAAVYVGGRFFLLGSFATLWTLQGSDWQASRPGDPRGFQAMAFGLGQYLLVGSGSPLFSTDAISWRASPVDCSIPIGACVTDPGGNTLDGLFTSAVFAAGSFYIDQARSSDAQNWQLEPKAYPIAFIGGHLVGDWNGFAAWEPGGDPHPIAIVRHRDLPADGASTQSPYAWDGSGTATDAAAHNSENYPQGPLPASIDFSWPDGLDCSAAPCVAIGSNLYLIPNGTE
jgi:hypothetical protein